MATGDTSTVRPRRLIGFALLIFLSVSIAFIVPLAAVPLGLASIAGGIVAYRRSREPSVRAVAVAAVVAGACAILTLAGMALFLAPAHGSIFSSISESTPIGPP